MGSNKEADDRTPLAELAVAITTGAVRIAAATAAWLRLVREFDERGGWQGIGIRSCAHWLAWQCGMGPGAAREHVRVARSLAALPRIEAAFAAGRLSYSKVRALTRVAAPDCEAALVEFAMAATASQTERFCRQWRRVDGEGPVRSADGLSFQHWTDDDGFVTLKVRMPAPVGAAVMNALDSLAEREARRERAQVKKTAAARARIRAAGGTIADDVEERCTEDAAAGQVRERRAARRIAALAALAEARAAMDRRPGDPPQREFVVHVDATVLAKDTAAGRAHIEGGPAITGAQARRMLCEATVVGMIERGSEPLALGRRKRRATKGQKRALLRRDGGCVRPGCPETRVERLHAHHMRHWLFGGRTDVDGMVLLCDVDHGLVHEHDLVLVRRDGRIVATTPEGQRLWGIADAAFAVGLARLPSDLSSDDAFAGVTPIDETIGRRPSGTRPASTTPSTPSRGPRRRRRVDRPAPSRPGRSGSAAGGPGGRSTLHRPVRSSVSRESRRLDRILFPDGAPDRPAPVEAPNERLDMAYAISVLMGNRDLVRRLEAERGAAT